MGQRVAYVEAPSGIAGDMLLGALVDLGLPVAVLEDVATRLGVDGLSVRAERVDKNGLSAVQVDVLLGGRRVGAAAHAHDKEHTHDHDHAHGHEHTHDHGDEPHEDRHHVHAHEHGDVPHHHLADVRRLLERLGPLDTPPLDMAWAAFEALAVAEARVHGVTPEEVAFHEVGAADAVLDIAGACIGLAHLGVERVVVGPLPWGRGTVRCAHGLMPNPAPATVHLLTGLPTVPSSATFEQVTPTGAALVRALAAAHEVPAGFVPESVGLGAGRHPGQGLPNVVRVTIGTAPEAAAREHVWQIETNVDDIAGAVAAHALEQVREAGALDAWATPVTMKKGRPGLVLGALADAATRSAVEDVLLRETGSLGVRAFPVERRILARHHVRVATPYGDVRVKVRSDTPGPEGMPELEDCRRLAEEAGVAMRLVLQAAQAAYDASR